jgi:hypothetical protein
MTSLKNAPWAAAWALVAASVLTIGCSRSDKGEVTRLKQENDELRAEAKRLLKENLDLKHGACPEEVADNDTADEDDELDDQSLDADEDELFSKTPIPTRALLAAKDAYVNGRYKQARSLAAIAAEKDPQKAGRISGAASCFMKDQKSALAAWKKADAQARQFIAYVCARNDITLE